MAKCEFVVKILTHFIIYFISLECLQAQQQLAYEFEQLRGIQTTLNSFKSDNHNDRPIGPVRTTPYEESNLDPDVWGTPQPRDPDVWPSPTPAEHR